MKRTIVLIAIGLIGLAVWWLSRIFPIVIVSVVLAYLLYPIASFIERRLLRLIPLKGLHNRGLAVLLTFVLIVALFVVILLLVLPVFVGQFEEFGNNLPQLLRDMVGELERILSQPITFNGEPIIIGDRPLIPLERLGEATGTQNISELLHLENLDIVGATQTFLGSVGGLTGPAFSFVGDAVTALVNLIFLVTMMFYLTKDGEYFVAKIVEATPVSYHGDMRRILAELARIWNAYLRGQLLIAVATGLIIFFAAVLLGVSSPLLLGLFSGVLQLIPNIGPFIAVLPAAFLALVSPSTVFPTLGGGAFVLVVIVVWVIIQNLILFLLVPRVMGRTLDLHPFVVIVTVIAGASVGGVLGLIIAVPFVASARLVGLYVLGKLTDQDLLPVAQSEPMPGMPDILKRLRSQVNIRLRENHINIQPLMNKVRRSTKHE